MRDPLLPSLDRPIHLVGDRQVTVTEADLVELPLRSREIEIVCATGDRYTERWQGIPIPELLDLMDPSPETTHLLVDSRDGHRVCIDVETALEGLLAVARDDDPLSTIGDYETRFVATGATGPRTVKGVAHIEAKTLAPDDDPETYERLAPPE
ncbi:molybdopterin-binding oxidoreductase [Natronococcus pandeyae]|uniref:Molybdopterin-binding oxidoreductase n=1 Tax=Natronococcus pandeyae TaxID=2055836 RepID=A0A8J8TNT7_9EURY|nr:molybdopterin-dependent oxidoreductase [Natronococcus pandeyae]TYL36683.1 molybdopterin-binding oxidoreductase [Natronococcus pandeyae]